MGLLEEQSSRGGKVLILCALRVTSTVFVAQDSEVSSVICTVLCNIQAQHLRCKGRKRFASTQIFRIRCAHVVGSLRSR